MLLYEVLDLWLLQDLLHRQNSNSREVMLLPVERSVNTTSPMKATVLSATKFGIIPP